MKIKYLGTAAFESIPGLFCNCEVCRNAVKNGGKDYRTRTQSVIDGKLLIDFPADTVAHFHKYKIDFGKFKTLLITHSHPDHLYPDDLLNLGYGFSSTENAEPLHIYVGESGKEMIEERCKSVIDEGKIIIHKLKPFEPFCAEWYKILPIPASHDEKSSPFIFAISDGKKTMLYGNDTGALKTEVLEKFLNNGLKFDLLSFDCTMGERQTEYFGHFNLNSIDKTVGILKDRGALKDGCKIVLTHFSHNHYVSHAYLQEKVKSSGYIVAYDGYTCNF